MLQTGHVCNTWREMQQRGEETKQIATGMTRPGPFC